jgi:hypothetical protein
MTEKSRSCAAGSPLSGYIRVLGDAKTEEMVCIRCHNLGFASECQLFLFTKVLSKLHLLEAMFIFLI